MKKQQNIPKGYKLTAIGIIPSDWDIMEMGDEIELLEAGVSVNSVDEEIFNGDPCVLKTSCVTNGKFLPDQRKKIKKEDIPRAAVNPKKDSILISRMNTPELVGEMGYVGETFKNLFLPDRLWQTVFKKNSKINVKWLNYLLNTPEYKLKIKSTATGTSNSMKNISKNAFLSIKIPAPPIVEQSNISNLLIIWDDFIYKLEKLINQKQLRKKWLMQQLLTGKKRLKGFKGNWKEVHIRDIAKEVSIRNKSDKQLTVLSCTKYDGLVPSLEYFGRKIFADDVSTYKVVPKHHFAYATNHIEEGSIGYQDSFDEALISPMYTVFKTDKLIDDVFLFKLLKSHHMISQYQSRMEGSIDRRGGLRWEAFSIIKIKVPSCEEQNAISRLLQTSDKEIEILNSRLDKFKEQKKGLMQVLLTGKKRLKIK